MDTELLPCPHCGESVFLQATYGHKNYYRSQCDNDNCPSNRWYDSETEAIKAWNTRHTQPIQLVEPDISFVFNEIDVS